MKYLTGYSFVDSDIESFAKRNQKKKSIFNREPIENFRISKPFWNPYRTIHFFNANNQLIATSVFDESNFPLVTDENEHLLLWRPRYADVNIKDAASESAGDLSLPEEESLQVFLMEIMDRRNEVQVASNDLTEELMDRQPRQRSHELHQVCGNKKRLIGRNEKQMDG
jgi:hypothetical protein